MFVSYQHLHGYHAKCHAKWMIIGAFLCCSGDTNEIKLSAIEQLYARAFHLRSRRKFDEADKLQSLVDSLCTGL